MIAFTDGANRTLTRTYTNGGNSISETVFLTVTEDTAKTVIRQARSEIDIHNLEGITINAISGTQSGATQGGLSAQLATFVSETRALTERMEVFPLVALMLEILFLIPALAPLFIQTQQKSQQTKT